MCVFRKLQRDKCTYRKLKQAAAEQEKRAQRLQQSPQVLPLPLQSQVPPPRQCILGPKNEQLLCLRTEAPFSCANCVCVLYLCAFALRCSRRHATRQVATFSTYCVAELSLVT